MPKHKNLLMIFTRNLKPGKVKKRLAAEIGDTAALRLYELLLKHTCEVTKNLASDKAVYYSEFIHEEDLWDNCIFQKEKQCGNDLGERMRNAFKAGFEKGYTNIVIIGSDLYDLREEDMITAFSNLERSDYVVGPAQDGGYYLLGMNSLNRRLFSNKAWGTDTVLQDTLQDLQNETLTLLEERNDIDTYEDLLAHPELQKKLKQNEQIITGNN